MHPLRRLPTLRWAYGLSITLTLLSALYLLLYVAWLITAQSNYGYEYWYQHYQIDKAIQRYGPQNRFRDGFEHTDADTHAQLFAQIAHSVHRQGQGLEQIHYSVGDQRVPLLRAPEMAHLRDVAQLIDQVHTGALISAIVWLLCWLWRRRIGADLKARHALVFALSTCLAVAVVIAAFGLRPTFHQLHVWIFTSGAPWFFYYQDSLMSTLMYAPYLFFGIGLQIALTALLLGGLWLAIAQYIKRRMRPSLAGFEAR